MYHILYDSKVYLNFVRVMTSDHGNEHRYKNMHHVSFLYTDQITYLIFFTRNLTL